MSSIVEDWISRANAKQRRGRAGRVRPGLCFCLYTHHRFEKLMRPFQVIAWHFLYILKITFTSIHQSDSLGFNDLFCYSLFGDHVS
jgi:hypothetical protein